MSVMVYAKAYLPLATLTNSGDVPAEWEASTQLTEFAETLSPSDASTAAWTCATRIGPAWSAITSRTASSTQPGRRARSLRLVMARGRAPLALRPASFLARRLNPDRASCADSAARSSDTILSIAPESWFEYPPLACIATQGGFVERIVRTRALSAGRVGAQDTFAAGADKLDVNEAFLTCTARAIACSDGCGRGCGPGCGPKPATPKGAVDADTEFTLYRGATFDDRVGGMFSFVPARPAGDSDLWFARPPIRIDGLINPASGQAPSGAGRPLDIDTVHDAWRSLAAKVAEAGLVLGVSLKIPAHKDLDGSASER